MTMTKYQVPPSDKFPISLAKGSEDVYLVIHLPIQGYRYSQSVEFSFFNASNRRLHLNLRPKDESHSQDSQRRRCCFPPAHWHGSPNAVWMIKFETSRPYTTPCISFSVSADGQTFPGYPVTYFDPDAFSDFDCYRGIDVVTYHYDVVHECAVTDAEKTATMAIFNGPNAELEAQSYFAKQLDPEVPFLALKDIEARERAVADQQEAFNSKEKALEEREQILHAGEVALELREGIQKVRKAISREREQNLHAREVAPEQRKATLPHLDGRGEPPASDIRPSDYDSIKISATKAWPGIIKEVFGKQVLDDWTEKYHVFMRIWVEERGDNLPSTSYDHLVYAHGVAWPRIVSQHTSNDDFVRVREKHAAFMRILI